MAIHHNNSMADELRRAKEAAPEYRGREVDPNHPTAGDRSAEVERENMENFAVPHLEGWGDLSQGLLFNVPTAAGTGRLYEVIDRLKKGLVSFQDKSNLKHLVFDVVSLDPEQVPFLTYPIAAVTVVDNNKLSFFSLIVDSGEAASLATEITVDGEPIQVLRLPSNTIETSGLEVLDVITKLHPKKSIIDATGAVLPQDFNLEDATKLDVLVRYIVNTIGVYMTMDTSNGLNLLNVVSIQGHQTLRSTSTLVKSPSASQLIVDETGMPVRADVRTRLTAPGMRDRSGRQSRALTVSESAGYVDLVYAPHEGRNGEKFTYFADYHLTYLNTPQRPSIDGMLLGLYSSFGVYQDGFAIASLAPSRQATANDAVMQDVSLLNIEANIDGSGKPIEGLDEVTTNDSVVHRYLQRIVDPEISFVIDYDEAGASTGRLYPFFAAADGDKDMLDYVMLAANNLTNGEFLPIYGSGNPFTIISSKPRGYWTDEEGKRRDIRDLDYIANFAMSHHDLTLVEDWQRFNLDMSIPQEVRLYNLKKTIEAIMPSAVITGLTHSIRVDLQFINALATGMSRAGVNTNFVVPNTRSGRDRYVPGHHGNNYEAYRGVVSSLRTTRVGGDRDNDRYGYRRTNRV